MTSFSVEVIELSHSYGTYLAVDRISFEIETGKTFGLIGPNGAGKSTTIKMLTTLLPVTSGTAFLNGFSVIDQPTEVRRSLGYVPQLVSADGELTGYEKSMLSAKLHALPRDTRALQIRRVLDIMDLGGVGDELVEAIRGHDSPPGNRPCLNSSTQSLDFGRADGGLDPGARKILWKHIEDLNRTLGTTILLTTHDMDEADHLCDEVALMHRGRIIVKDTPSRLKAALGPDATLDDVFIHHTGSSLKKQGIIAMSNKPEEPSLTCRRALQTIEAVFAIVETDLKKAETRPL